MIKLLGLYAHNPQGYLAALGVLRIASLRQLPARLGWIDGVCCFEGAELDDLVHHLTDYASSRAASPEYNIAKAMQQDAISMDRYLELLSDRGGTRPWVEAMWYPDQGRGGKMRGKLCLMSTSLHLGGRQETWPTVRSAVKAVTAEKLRVALTEEWPRVDHVSSLGWDPAGLKVAATLAGTKEPTAAKHQTEAATLWLAAEALPWLPARVQSMAFFEEAWHYLVPVTLVSASDASHLLKIGHWVGRQELAARGWELYSASRVKQGQHGYALTYGARTPSAGRNPRGSRGGESREKSAHLVETNLRSRLLLV